MNGWPRAAAILAAALAALAAVAGGAGSALAHGGGGHGPVQAGATQVPPGPAAVNPGAPECEPGRPRACAEIRSAPTQHGPALLPAGQACCGTMACHASGAVSASAGAPPALVAGPPVFGDSPVPPGLGPPGLERPPRSA